MSHTATPTAPTQTPLCCWKPSASPAQQCSASNMQFSFSWASEVGVNPVLVVTGRMLPSVGRVGELAGCKAIRSHCPARGNSNFYEHLNDNTSP